jgi:hypothetical protein
MDLKNNIKYKYYRDVDNRPVITVCVITDGCKKYRGISICSPKDNPDKNIGRAISYNRAVRAFSDTINQRTNKICRLEVLRQLRAVGFDKSNLSSKKIRATKSHTLPKNFEIDDCFNLLNLEV